MKKIKKSNQEFIKKIAIAALIVIALFLTFINLVGATNDKKVKWCHCAASGVCNTLELPQQALEQAGHFNAQGNPLHAGDHAGECSVHQPTLTTTPTETPVATDSPTLTPTARTTDTPTPTTFHPSATPTTFHPSATPGSPNAVNEVRGEPEKGGNK